MKQSVGSNRVTRNSDGSNISWINVDPLLDPLHGDARFEALVQKVIPPKK